METLNNLFVLQKSKAGEGQRVQVGLRLEGRGCGGHWVSLYQWQHCGVWGRVICSILSWKRAVASALLCFSPESNRVIHQMLEEPVCGNGRIRKQWAGHLIEEKRYFIEKEIRHLDSPSSTLPRNSEEWNHLASLSLEPTWLTFALLCFLAKDWAQVLCLPNTSYTTEPHSNPVFHSYNFLLKMEV